MKWYHWLLIALIPLAIIFIVNYAQQKMCVNKCKSDDNNLNDEQCIVHCKDNYATRL